MEMTKTIKNEIYKFFKSKKNIIVIILFFAYLLCINFYNLKEYKIYMKEIKQEYLNNYAQADGFFMGNARLLVSRSDILTDEEIEEIEKQMEFYKVERSKLKLIEGKYVNNRPEYYRDILIYKNERYENIIKGLNDGVIKEDFLLGKNSNIEEIQKEVALNQYILDNEIEPVINPYTMTGANSLVMFLKGNNLIILVFLIALLSIDIYLSEVEEGSYKLSYTQPFERKDIFLGKVITILIISMLLIVLGAILNFGAISSIYEVGNMNYPFIANENINQIVFNNNNTEYTIMPLWKYVLLGFGLLLSIVIFTITLIICISIFTDSSKKTMGTSIMLLILAFIFDNFLTKQSIVNLIYPYSYIYIRNAIEVNKRSNYLFGILLNSLMSIGLFIMSYYKFIQKDFLGTKE
ncbi:ABC transporter permease subunit [Tissierella praeacuta]|uniref:ABC transporter permease n=1 Tax=Tissierella praeacuta TaxID=43131 RepID=UPI003340802F